MIKQTRPPAAILIATLGTEPQVVTATLDLLLRQNEAIDRLVVVHTSAPGSAIEAAVQTLQDAFAGGLYAGQATLQLAPLCDPTGRPLADVETPEAAQAAFRTLYNLTRLAHRSHPRVHLSIAGGRKTLSVYGMLTAQLLFDDEDRLWHLYSAGDFLASKRLHPQPGDDVRLIPIPVVRWARISPMLLDLAEIDDPLAALQRQETLRLEERLDEMRAFVHGVLTAGEERAVRLLAQEGLSDAEIAARLNLSPRTVESQLRQAYLKAAAHWNLPGVTRAQLISLLNLFYSLSEQKEDH